MTPLRILALAAGCATVLAPAVATARPDVARRVQLPAQPLRTTLQTLARLYQVELLFSDDVVGDSRAAAVSGIFRFEEALPRALAGSGCELHRSHGGGYVVLKAPRRSESTTAPPVPEIVVIGRHTQNADIQRYTNDVQPYQVLTRAEVRRAHASSVEELIGKRMSADARGLSLSQMPISGQGSPQSTIDLRGLGADETLVLVDGRRMPRLPNSRLEFVQPDLNGLSPEAIERVEVATSTAGGIHGPGAVAGVVNLVLRRDYRGAEIAVTNGITQRGDAAQARIDARVGFTPDHGATDVMLGYSRSSNAGLRVGDRDFATRAATRAFANNANVYWFGDLPAANSVNVASSARTPLTLKPAFGGGSLGSFVSHLPTGDGRSTLQTGTLLLSNAGQVDTVPAVSGEGGRASLTTSRAASSILANVRHRFGGIEVYGDFLQLIDRGRIATQSMAGILRLDASDPRNPFQQAIDISFPAAPLAATIRQRIVTTRGGGGLVATLPGDWKANLDLGSGSARQEMVSRGSMLAFDGWVRLNGYPTPGGGPIDPFGGSETLRSALAAQTVAYAGSLRQTNRMTDLALRLAGSVVDLPGGKLYVTLLAEQRSERVAAATSRAQYLDIPIVTAVRGYGERVRSGYVELRAPLLSERAAFAPLRGLEVQLAARIDSTRVDATPDPLNDPTIVYDRFTGAERAALVYTAGLKLRPMSGLLLRASLATGEMAPPIEQLAGIFLLGLRFLDAKRGNQIVSAASYGLTVYKDPLVPERAQTLSVGFVAAPFGADGAKLSIDYARIRRSREAAGRGGNVFSILYHEDLYPGRVTRGPLTPEDAARGYTGGVITAIDASYTTLGWTRIDAVDGRLDVPIRLSRPGDVALRMAATWQPSYRRFVSPGAALQELTNRSDGALALRGNAGLDWQRGPLGIALSAQYYGRYSVRGGVSASDSLNTRYVVLQGANRIPAAVTIDLAIEYRFPLGGSGESGGGRPRTLDLRFGIQDLLDRRPATVLNAERSYSFYADPRRRRFELTLATGI